jgi:RNA recognition motif-containing protein
MGNKLYVGNLPYSVTEGAVQDFFAAAGTVESVRIITDKMSGRSKGFGFVEMATSEEALKAIDTLNGKELDGRALNVSEAKAEAPRTGGGFGGGGGGGRRFDGGGNRGGGSRFGGNGGGGGQRNRW